MKSKQSLKIKIYLILILFILFFCAMAAAACIHDNIIMRDKIASMRASILTMQQQQAKQNDSIRQIKTDADIILRIAAGGDFVEVEE